MQIINLLGGRENIEDVDACMTRLRVTVKNPQLVGNEDNWRKAGAMGLIVKNSGVQAVYGPKADILKSDIQDLLDSNETIPTVDFAQITDKNSNQSQFKGLTETVYSVCDGLVLPIDNVKDPVFAGK